MDPNQISSRIQCVDLIERSWLGVVERLESLFSKTSGVCGRDIQVIPAVDAEDFERLQQQKGQTLELPVIVVAPIQVEPNAGSYNASVMRRTGVSLQIDDDRINWTVVKLLPVVLSLQVTLVTDDVVTMLRMISRWTSNEIWGFELKQASWGAKIQVVADKLLAVPPRITTTGGSRQYRLATTLRAATYSGFVWLVPSIRKFQLETLIPLNGTIADALENPEVLAQVAQVRDIVVEPPFSPVQFEPEM